MKIKIIASISLIFTLTFGIVQTASADSFFFSVNPSGVFMDGAATYDGEFGPNAGIALPDSALSSFAMGITLPLTYTTGDTIFVGVTWHTDAETPCTAELRPNFISVARAGSSHIIGSGASTGLSSNDENNNLEASATNASSMKIYKITPPDGVTDLKPLDVINFCFFRPADDSNDTCAGTVVIQGIAVGAL